MIFILHLSVFVTPYFKHAHNADVIKYWPDGFYELKL